MKKAQSWMFKIHRWVGAVVGLFFLMWCLSGLVLVYHPFPNVDERDLQARMEPLPDSLPGSTATRGRGGEGADGHGAALSRPNALRL